MPPEDRKGFEPTKQQFVTAVAEYAKQASEANNRLNELVYRLLEARVLEPRDISALNLFTIVPHNGSSKVGPVPTPSQRKKRPVDPDAPKRPLPGYLAYSNQEKKKIKEEMAKDGQEPLSMAQLNVYVQNKWNNLPESVREQLRKDHEIAIKRYNEEMKEYRERKTEA